MTEYFPHSTAASPVVLSMAAGDYVFVAPGVVLSDSTLAYYAILDSSWGTAVIDGAVAASAAVSFEGAVGQETTIQIGATGVVSGTPDYSTIFVGAGSYSITNNGEVLTPGTAFDLRCSGILVNTGTISATQDGVSNIDSTTTDTSYVDNYGTITSTDSNAVSDISHDAYIVNYGTISASVRSAISDNSTSSETIWNYGKVIGGTFDAGNSSSVFNAGLITNLPTEAAVIMQASNCSVTNVASGEIESVVLQGGNESLDNAGTIDGRNGYAVYFSQNNNSLDNSGSINGNLAVSGGNSALVNSGVISGAVTLSGSNTTFNATLGSVNGEITATAAGDTIIAGQTGGAVLDFVGGVLYANPTATAATNAATTALAGEVGDNWLYGDGAFTTFASGLESAGKYNQIFGGRSQMSGVAGYTNNTVDYADLSSAYKSADINLLNGDAYMCTLAKASGAPAADLVFEDYLQNVPNVIGSSGGDVIICDNGVDKITSGANKGGDVIEAGVGAGSQDTFAFTAVTESPLSNYDVIEGFKVGVDKLDFSALDLPIADFLLSYGGAGSNTIYVEQHPASGFNAATDMIISVKASTNAAIGYGDLVL